MKKEERVEYFIVKKCLNKCIFCSESDKFDGSETSFEQIKKVLKREQKKGCRIMHFMGGEPTIHTDFEKILILAKNLSLLTHIITNGIMFSSLNFCRKTLPYLDEIMVSIHGPNAKIHNLHTRNKTSFQRAKKGLENLNKFFKGRLLLTTTITSKNLSCLHKMVDFASRYKVKELQYIAVIPSGRGRGNFYEITPPFSLLKKSIEKIISQAEKKDLILRFAGIPMCVLGEKGYVFSHDLWENFKVKNQAEHNGKLSLWKEPTEKNKNFEIDIGRIKVLKCRNCRFKDICGGIYKKYYQKYGAEELKPFTG